MDRLHKFIVFYDDGSISHGDETTLADVEPFGVICIVQEKQDGRNHIISQKDYYAFINNKWIVLDTMGLVDYNVHQLDKLKRVIVGRTVDSASYWEIFDKAKKYV